MSEDQDSDNRKRNYSNRRSIMDYGMGIIIMGIGVFFFLAPRLGFDFQNIGTGARYAFAGLCILYGGFRAFRGYQKNYFD